MHVNEIDTAEVLPDTYNILIVANDYLPVIDSVTILRDTVLNFTLNSYSYSYSISGKITDAKGNPIYPAFIFGFDTAMNDFYCAISDINGNYNLNYNGEIYLYCIAENYTGCLYPSTFSFKEATLFSSNASNIDFNLSFSEWGGFVLHGKLLSAEKSFKTGIVLAIGKSTYTGISSPTGEFYLIGLKPQIYKIVVNTPDFVSDTAFAAAFDLNVPVVSIEAGLKLEERKQIMRKRLRISPNPARNVIRVNCKENITIYDISGRKICSLKNENGIINVSHLPSGIYFIKTKDSRMEKLIILR